MMGILKETQSTVILTRASIGEQNPYRSIYISSRFIALFLTFLTCSQLPSFAKEQFDWINFNTDKRPYAPHKITANLSYGVTMGLDAEVAKNRNLDINDDEDEDEIQSSVKLGFLYDNKAHFRTYLEFELSHEIAISRSKNDTSGFSFEINEAYITYRNLDGNLAFTIGRWAVSDDREWLFDEEMDGVQFSWQNTRLAFIAMYAREELIQKDLFGDHDDDEPDYYYIRFSGRTDYQSSASIYGLYQNGRKPSEPDLFWLGGALLGKTVGGADYWADFAMVRGNDNGRDVRGFGFDIGVTKKLKNMSWEPRLTASVAFGTGDDGGGTDTAYRQTEIKGNGGRFGGRKSFKYYGEVFDPELSNLGVVTLGAGFDLKKKTSIDFVYHNYFQHHASKKIRDSNLNAKPSGISRQLGSELDIIVGYRGNKNFKTDLTLGVFMPGAAFANNDNSAWFIEVEFEKKF